MLQFDEKMRAVNRGFPADQHIFYTGRSFDVRWSLRCSSSTRRAFTRAYHTKTLFLRVLYVLSLAARAGATLCSEITCAALPLRLLL